MAAKNPVAYAEKDLGVHRIYEAAIAQQMEYAAIVVETERLRSRRRDLETNLIEAETEVTVTVYASHSDTSQAARDRATKAAIASDPKCREIRRDITDISNELSEKDATRAIIEMRIKIATSRMIELGGYFQYLASAKSAATAKAAALTVSPAPSAPTPGDPSPWG